MSPVNTDLEWVAEQLSDAPAATTAATDRARNALMHHIDTASVASAPARRRRRFDVPALHPLRLNRPASYGLAAVAAASAAFAVVNVTSDSGSGGVGTARAAAILAHAAQGDAPGAGQVLETTMTDSAGNIDALAFDARTPQDDVQTLTAAGGRPYESGVQGGLREFYDAATNTIYRDSVAPEAIGISAGDQGLLDELNAPGDQTTVDDNASLDGQPVKTVTSKTPSGIVYELWVRAGTDLPVQFTETSASGAVSKWTMSYETVTPNASTPSPAVLTALHPSATVTTLGDSAYKAELAKLQPAPSGNTGNTGNTGNS